MSKDWLQRRGVPVANYFFIDTSRCIACRGCQISCKQWNNLPGSPAKQKGSHQNPDDLSSTTFKLVRFSEVEVEGKPVWYFFTDQCRHCLKPKCLDKARSLGYKNISIDEETGAVLHNPKVRVKGSHFQKIRNACGFDIPRRSEKTGGMAKCDMCISRVKEGLLPACVKACPTGTMNFGDKEKIFEMAQKRLKEVMSVHPMARLLHPEHVHTVFLVVDDPSRYHEFAGFE